MTQIKSQPTSGVTTVMPYINAFILSNAPHPYDQAQWVRMDFEIPTDGGGKKLLKSIEVPANWSRRSAQIASDKYLTGKEGTVQRETSLRAVLTRISETIAAAAVTQGKLSSTSGAAFERDLAYLMLGQRAAFNSPVWFNVGVKKDPQCSACFILQVEDDMTSIANWAVQESKLFKQGSGSGVNISAIRAKGERLGGGGRASGPVSFMRGPDASAGAIKSGGTTRRAAKMVVLNVNHPDIQEFVDCKRKEESKGKVLIKAGFEGGFEGDVIGNLQYQNGNNSVRVTDAFMEAALADKPFTLVGRKDQTADRTISARKLLRRIAKAAWACGDPGMQYHDTINKMNTVAAAGVIEASNPCSEYMFLNNTSCNLASINLLKFLKCDGSIDSQGLSSAVRVLTIAMDTIVDMAGYPTEEVAQMSRRYRTLGLGFANLGALLLELGLPYDSPEGRNLAGALMSFISATAYAVSNEMAQAQGPFEAWESNKAPMHQVINRHWEAAIKLRGDLEFDCKRTPAGRLAKEGLRIWSRLSEGGQDVTYRNAQVSVLAPTGTIGFVMDCDTTGIEPVYQFFFEKALAGGGKLVTVMEKALRSGLKALAYSPQETEALLARIKESSDVDPTIFKNSGDAKVFQAACGQNALTPLAHLKMMAACQPFVSGAISKTVNLPHEATVEEIEATYVEAWKLGLKAVAVYRDGSKAAQVMTSLKKAPVVAKALSTPSAPPVLRGTRERLPETRQSVTHKFSISGMEGYLTVGLYPDGRPGEIFVNLGKEGSSLQGFASAWATAVSIGIQSGVPMELFVSKAKGMRFEPHGFTASSDNRLRTASSVMDYIGKWLEVTFASQGELLPVRGMVQVPAPAPEAIALEKPAVVEHSHKLCSSCGSIMQQTGTCHTCPNCGTNSGGCS